MTPTVAITKPADADNILARGERRLPVALTAAEFVDRSRMLAASIRAVAEVEERALTAEERQRRLPGVQP